MPGNSYSYTFVIYILAWKLSNFDSFSREAERRAKEKLIEYISNSTMNSTVTSSTTTTTNGTNHYNYNHFELNNSNGFHHIDSSRIEMTGGELDSPPPGNPQSAIGNPGLNTTSNHHFDAEISQISLEIERVGKEYHEESRNLQEQLQTFRQEIDKLKVDDNVTNMDKLHQAQQEQGNNKYSTIQKVKRGTTQTRIDIFEEL